MVEFNSIVVPDKPNDAGLKSGHKLGPKLQIAICLYLAQGFSPPLVVQFMKEDYNIEMSNQNIYKNYLYRPRWRKFIHKLKTKYCSEILKHPLADKFNRLAIIQKGIQAVINEKKNSKSMGTLASLVKEARAEIEGDPALMPTIHQKILIVQNNGKSEQANEFLAKLTNRVEKVSE